MQNKSKYDVPCRKARYVILLIRCVRVGSDASEPTRTHRVLHRACMARFGRFRTEPYMRIGSRTTARFAKPWCNFTYNLNGRMESDSIRPLIQSHKYHGPERSFRAVTPWYIWLGSDASKPSHIYQNDVLTYLAERQGTSYHFDMYGSAWNHPNRAIHINMK